MSSPSFNTRLLITATRFLGVVDQERAWTFKGPLRRIGIDSSEPAPASSAGGCVLGSAFGAEEGAAAVVACSGERSSSRATGRGSGRGAIAALPGLGRCNTEPASTGLLP